jgi:hypothetical protein
VSQEIEINLRIPRVKEPIKDAHGTPINNADIRFTMRIQVPTIPKVGELIPLSTRTGRFDGSVTRTEWSDAKELFIIYCQYSERAIPQEEYQALMNDPHWTRKPLLP